jgi:hypothetical protein
MPVDLTTWRGAGNVSLDDISGNNISDILARIQDLQASERRMINELDAYTSTSGFVSSDPNLIRMVNNINNIANARISMFQMINQNAGIIQSGVSQSRIDLVSQMTLLDAVEDQLNQAKTKIDELQSTNDTKMRMVEINTYYGQRYEAQSNLMKKIIIICIPILIVFILKKKSLIPETIANYIIGIIVAISAFILMFNIWDIYTRNNMHFDQYEWKYESPSAHSPSIWEYNKQNMFNFDKLFQDLMSNLGICVTDKCCATGTVYSKKKSKCVLPADAIQGFTTMNNNNNPLEGFTTCTGLKGDLNGGEAILPYSSTMAFASV